MRRHSSLTLLLIAAFGVAASGTAAATVRRDGTPTSLAKQAKAFGITKAGPKYRFHKQQASSGTLRLTVEVPTAWSDTADSHFIRPDTQQPYGVGVRATTNADKFHNSFDVPGLKVTVDVETASQAASFDPIELVTNNAYKGCRNGSVRNYDNGTFSGKFQVFDRCGKRRAAAVVVAANDGGTIVLAAAQVLTKADLGAVDRALRTVKIDKTSI